jgi:S-DNA-T family DNA segregation ATPase FtsK/SpoIIIE
VMLHLQELPHVLIAGATGAGKSSCINALVTSILMRTTPDQVRLILVDPKRVELGQYNDVPHLLTRVINNPKKAADALQWVVREMDARYDLLADAEVRDVEGYYEKYDADLLDHERFERFPFIVVVIDELNDLMMVAGRAVEEAVVRIAQMARAVGIHLVIATQRPSVDVITGVIKANIPSRLAFSVASQTDSRVILDTVGAEKLVGLGDMIMVTSREPKPERIQGAWVSEAEIHAVAGWARQQAAARYEQQVLEPSPEASGGEEEGEFEGEDPAVMREAIEMVVRSQLGSTSMLQRKLRIGFARAGRVMDIMEHMGIVGPSEGSKARAVLVSAEELDQLLGAGSLRP